MRKLLLCFILLLNFNLYSQDTKLIASCCEKTETKSFGRCSGNASCTACSSCRYCKHCSAGGTCGVCASYTPAPAKTTKRQTRTQKSSNINNYYSSSSSVSVNSYGDKLIVISENLNLREDAGTNYDVVEKLYKGDILTFISNNGDWTEVRVLKSGNKGYVISKYVK